MTTWPPFLHYSAWYHHIQYTTSMSTVFCCKFSIKERARVPGEGRQVNTTVFLGSSAHFMKSSLEKPHVRSATDANTTFGSGTLARSARLWHKVQYLTTLKLMHKIWESDIFVFELWIEHKAHMIIALFNTVFSMIIHCSFLVSIESCHEHFLAWLCHGYNVKTSSFLTFSSLYLKMFLSYVWSQSFIIKCSSTVTSSLLAILSK